MPAFLTLTLTPRGSGVGICSPAPSPEKDRRGYRSATESRSSLLCLDTKLSSFLPKQLMEEPKPCSLQAKTQIIHPTQVQRPRLHGINLGCPDLAPGPCTGMPGAFGQLSMLLLPPASSAVWQSSSAMPLSPACLRGQTAPATTHLSQHEEQQKMVPGTPAHAQGRQRATASGAGRPSWEHRRSFARAEARGCGEGGCTYSLPGLVKAGPASA